MFKRILVSLDGSELSEIALPYVEELAGIFNSKVELVYVCESAETEYRHMHQLYIEKIAQQVQSNIEAYHPGTKLPAAQVKPVILDGEPAAEIINYADKNNISLIVIASHGRSGILPWPMGSTADKIMHGTNKPVIMIKATTAATKVSKGKLFNKILLPLDGSDTGEAALPYVKELARKTETEIVLLQVVTPGQYTHTVGGLNYVLFPEQQIEKMQSNAGQYLEKTGRKLKNTKAKIKSAVKTGQAAQEIIKFAEETDARLVAISTHGHSGIRQWISGSVTLKVLQVIRTPVLVIRAPEVKS